MMFWRSKYNGAVKILKLSKQVVDCAVNAVQVEKD